MKTKKSIFLILLIMVAAMPSRMSAMELRSDEGKNHEEGSGGDDTMRNPKQEEDQSGKTAATKSTENGYIRGDDDNSQEVVVTEPAPSDEELHQKRLEAEKVIIEAKNRGLFSDDIVIYWEVEVARYEKFLNYKNRESLAVSLVVTACKQAVEAIYQARKEVELQQDHLQRIADITEEGAVKVLNPDREQQELEGRRAAKQAEKAAKKAEQEKQEKLNQSRNRAAQIAFPSLHAKITDAEKMLIIRGEEYQKATPSQKKKLFSSKVSENSAREALVKELDSLLVPPKSQKEFQGPEKNLWAARLEDYKKMRALVAQEKTLLEGDLKKLNTTEGNSFLTSLDNFDTAFKKIQKWDQTVNVKMSSLAKQLFDATKAFDYAAITALVAAREKNEEALWDHFSNLQELAHAAQRAWGDRVLQLAERGEQNFGLGYAYREDQFELGRLWVGPRGTPYSDKYYRGSISEDKLRRFRYSIDPDYKLSPKVEVNFEEQLDPKDPQFDWWDQSKSKNKTNGHLNKK